MSLNEEWSQVAANAIAHQAMLASNCWQMVAYQHERPSVLFKPKLSIDGNMYCALYGSNLIDGIAGFGETADKAMADFDKNWVRMKAPAVVPDTKDLAPPA